MCLWMTFTAQRAAIVLLTALALHELGGTDLLPAPDPPSGNFTALVVRHGYRGEEHTVATEDGYLLTVFRIRRGRGCRGAARGTPVYLLHGLLQSAEVFLAAGPGAGPAYLLADACHDTWAGNVRGNVHGRRHQRWDPDVDREFWEFSTDEMGYYDVPATVDYVLNVTGAARVHLVGYSQGGGCALAVLAERPEYLHKVGALVGLAPSTGLRHITSPFRHVFRLSAAMEGALDTLGVHEILPKFSVIQRLAENFCRLAVVRNLLCRGFFDTIDAPNPGSVADATYERAYDHFPVGTSLRTMARYGQALRAGVFQKYDFGEKENRRRYGHVRPPAYRLGLVRVPVLLLAGRADLLVPLEDSRQLARALPHAELVVVDDPQWNHFDLVFSRNIKKVLFPKIHQYLLKYGDP